MQSRRRPRWSLLLAVAFLAAEPAPHGGNFPPPPPYRGPSDAVSPNPGPLPVTGGTAPSGNPAVTTGKPGGGPTTGGPVAVARRRATTGAMERGAERDGPDTWEEWWLFNREPLLRLRDHLDQRTVVTESVGFYTGRGTVRPVESASRPSPEFVRYTLVPELLPLLEETSAEVADSAALSLARMLRPEDAELALWPLVKALRHSAPSVRQAAAMALGVLGSGKAQPMLEHLLLDTRTGRSMTEHPEAVEDLVQAFAAASLGMIGEASTAGQLQNLIQNDRFDGEHDLQSLAVLALGMMPGEHESIVPFLVARLTDRKLDRTVRAQVPIALGKLHELSPQSGTARSALSALVSLLEDDATDRAQRQSVVLALGMLARVEDTEAVDALAEVVVRDTDPAARHFALMALAQIGARDERRAAHAEAQQRLLDLYLEELVRPVQSDHPPFAALALALHARSDGSTRVVEEAGTRLLESFQKSRQAGTRSACAVALGLLGYTDALEDLERAFEDSRDAKTRSYLALSFGLLRARALAPRLLELFRDKGTDLELRLEAARALGLMGDAQAVGELVYALETATSLSESVVAAKALGLIGDRRAIEPLLAIVRDPAKNPLQRGFAVIALGTIAEKTPLPWNTSFSVNSNYVSMPAALREIVDIL